MTGCCSPQPGSWGSWCGWRSASTGGSTASTSPPATAPPARRTTHPGQPAQPVYYLLYLHTVSTVYYLYYIYTPCLLSTYLLFTPQHRAGHLHGHRPRAHLHHSQRANILLLLCQRFCVLLRNIWCLPVFPKTILILICICIRSYHLCK